MAIQQEHVHEQPEAVEQVQKAEEKTPKGVCPICGKEVARGMFFHMKSHKK